MFQEFNIIDIIPNYADKTIKITTTFDIDPDSVNDSTISILNKHGGLQLGLSFYVDKKEISIFIKDEIVPNIEYYLRINNGLKTVIGDELRNGVRRRIVFKSAINKIPEILSPAYNQIINKLNVIVSGIDESVFEMPSLDDEDDVVKVKAYYYIQISKDMAFINNVFDTMLFQDEGTFKLDEECQYYMRCRIEGKTSKGDKIVGPWGSTTTFVLAEIEDDVLEDEKDKPDYDYEDAPNIEPEFIEEIKILLEPENGCIPESFLFEFSEEIDPDFIDGITIIRRDV